MIPLAPVGRTCLTSGSTVLRLAPPLVAGPEHVDHALEILAEVLR